MYIYTHVYMYTHILADILLALIDRCAHNGPSMAVINPKGLCSYIERLGPASCFLGTPLGPKYIPGPQKYVE